MTDVPEFIAHHGVKGMKWGVHRSEGALARAGHRTAEFAKTGKGRAFITSAIAIGGTAAVYGLAPQTFAAGAGSVARIFEAQHHERVTYANTRIEDLHSFGNPKPYNYGAGRGQFRPGG